jgi:hypothetical protein
MTKLVDTLKRDQHSGALLNTDAAALTKYKTERMYYRKIDKLQSDVNEIQMTLRIMCEKIKQLENK